MDYPALITAISDAHRQAQAEAAGAVNRHLVSRNWLIGAYLIEFEQSGEDRAESGAGLLERVSADLREREVPGASPDMLERMRLLYLHYPQMAERISAPLVRKLPLVEPVTPENDIPAQAMRKSADRTPRPLPIEKLLELSWTHLADLVRLEDPWKRAFHENECLKGHRSKRQLQRQIGSLLYERSGLSTDKETVIERARQQAMETPGQIICLSLPLGTATFLDHDPHNLYFAPRVYALDHSQTPVRRQRGFFPASSGRGTLHRDRCRSDSCVGHWHGRTRGSNAAARGFIRRSNRHCAGLQRAACRLGRGFGAPRFLVAIWPASPLSWAGGRLSDRGKHHD